MNGNTRQILGTIPSKRGIRWYKEAVEQITNLTVQIRVYVKKGCIAACSAGSRIFGSGCAILSAKSQNFCVYMLH
jgi:hypothetical protein